MEFKPYPHLKQGFVFPDYPENCFLIRLLNFRKACLTRKKGDCSVGMVNALGELTKYFTRNPKRSREDVRFFIRRNKDLIIRIMPGITCSAHGKFQKELNELLSGQEHTSVLSAGLSD